MAGAQATTRLERLAAQVPLPPDELRALLRRLIAEARARLAANAPALPTVRLVCEQCGGGYLVAESRAAVVLRSGARQVCPEGSSLGPTYPFGGDAIIMGELRRARGDNVGELQPFAGMDAQARS
jgi:hypothetical protein